MNLQNLTKEHRYTFMSDKAKLMDNYHKDDLYKSHLDFFTEKCFHIDLDNSIFKMKGNIETVQAISNIMDLLDISPSPANFRLLDYANFALVYGFINISYAKSESLNFKNKSKLTIGDPNSILEFFKPLDIFGEGVSFYENLFKQENYASDYLANFNFYKGLIIEKIKKNDLNACNIDDFKSSIRGIKKNGFIPEWYYTDDEYSIKLSNKKSEDLIKIYIENFEKDILDLNHSTIEEKNIFITDNTARFLNQEKTFNNTMIEFRNWIKDFILEVTKVLNPLISIDELNSVQFIFNEKGTSLETFKKYVDAQNSTFMKIMSDYEKAELDQSENLQFFNSNRPE